MIVYLKKKNVLVWNMSDHVLEFLWESLHSPPVGGVHFTYGPMRFLSGCWCLVYMHEQLPVAYQTVTMFSRASAPSLLHLCYWAVILTIHGQTVRATDSNWLMPHKCCALPHFLNQFHPAALISRRLFHPLSFLFTYPCKEVWRKSQFSSGLTFEQRNMCVWVNVCVHQCIPVEKNSSSLNFHSVLLPKNNMRDHRLAEECCSVCTVLET